MTSTIIGRANFIVSQSSSRITMNSAHYYGKKLEYTDLIKQALPHMRDGSYEIQVSENKQVRIIKKISLLGFDVAKVSLNAKAINGAFKSSFFYQIRKPQIQPKPKTGTAAKCHEWGDFILRKQAYLAKFCDVAKLLRWGFLALTFGMVIFGLTHGAFIPPIFGIGIVVGIPTFLIACNIRRLKKAKKENDAKEKKIAYANIIFSLFILALLIPTLPLLIHALHGASAMSLVHTGFKATNILFGVLNGIVGLVLARQGYIRYKSAKKNENEKEIRQAKLNILFGFMLFATGICALITTSYILAVFIESTTILNIGFSVYNINQTRKLIKNIEKGNIKEFLQKQLIITQEEHDKLQDEVKNYSRQKIDQYIKEHLSKEQQKQLRGGIIKNSLDLDEWRDLILKIRLQKLQDKKVLELESIIGKALTKKAKLALENNNFKTIKEEIIKEIKKRQKVEIAKIITPLICLGAFITLSVPMANDNLQQFLYATMQLSAKAISAPLNYEKRWRNIPTEEEAALEPIGLIDSMQSFYKPSGSDMASSLPNTA